MDSVNPTFPGGIEGLTAFFENLKSQIVIRGHSTLEPTVFVEFIVNTDGSVGDFVVLKGLGAEADEEAVRIASAMPSWTPGTLNGKPVRTKFVIPIKFRSETSA